MVLSRKQKLKVIKRFQNGEDKEALAKEIDVHEYTINRWLREYKQNPKNCFQGKGNSSLRELKKENSKTKRKLRVAELKLKIYHISNKCDLLCTNEKFQFIKSNRSHYPLKYLCEVLGVSDAGYRSWLKRTKTVQEVKDDNLYALVLLIFEYSKRTYGSTRICKELNKKGIAVSEHRIRRIMKINNLRSVLPQKKFSLTDSKHNFFIADDLVKRNFMVDEPSKVWVSDISYIKDSGKRYYLTVYIDLFDRTVVGYHLSKRLDVENTTIPALRKALANRSMQKDGIIHSDRGSQYACKKYYKFLAKNELKPSMGRTGNCFDNAVAESFFKTLKYELIYNHYSDHFSQFYRKLRVYILKWYNIRRIHSSLYYLTPFEKLKQFFIKDIC